MTPKKAKSSAGGQWIDKISDMFGETEKNLDQVKKAVQEDLKNLKKQKEFESLAVNLMMTAEEGFKKDLEEIGIVGDAQAQYLELFKKNWEQMEMKKKSAEILNSPELAAMDGFISKMENLPKLKEVIESAEPQPKWQAMIAGFASQFPGLDKYINEYFGPVLESIGLGFLVKPKKGKEEGKKEVKGKKTEGKKADKKPAESEETPEEEKKKPIIPEGPLDGPEQVPESFRPGKTLITSDSNFAVLEANMHKDLQEILNTSPQEMLSKGSMQSSWGLNQLRSKPAEYFKDLEYAVIGFGSNDLGSDDSAETIWGRLNEIAQVLKEKNPNIKVLMATIPPAKGNTYGLWGSNFDLVEEKRAEINKRIKQAQIDGQIDEVIDLAAKHQEGGLADDKDPSAMAKTFWRHGDRVHAKADALAKAVRRTQYKNSTKAA